MCGRGASCPVQRREEMVEESLGDMDRRTWCVFVSLSHTHSYSHCSNVVMLFCCCVRGGLTDGVSSLVGDNCAETRNIMQ